jgi:triosephosphate isomerase
VWAIGTGVSAGADDAGRVASLIRGELARLGAPWEVRIQYGGSVKPDNIAAFMAEKDIDGALVGGASLDPDVFAQLVKAAVV